MLEQVKSPNKREKKDNSGEEDQIEAQENGDPVDTVATCPSNIPYREQGGVMQGG